MVATCHIPWHLLCVCLAYGTLLLNGCDVLMLFLASGDTINSTNCVYIVLLLLLYGILGNSEDRSIRVWDMTKRYFIAPSLCCC